VEDLRGSDAKDVMLLPYNPLGMEMATCLGRPSPPLPTAFMNPDEEKEIYDWFQRLLVDKGQVRRAVLRPPSSPLPDAFERTETYCRRISVAP
jgi:hypothetical protein